MSTATTTVPEQGQLVSVRSRNWIVNDVGASTIATDRLSAARTSSQNLLSLSSIKDDGLGEQLQIIWELEPGARVIEKVALPEPTGFDPPERLDAFLDAETKAEPVRKMLRFERDLKKHIDGLLEQYRETERELRLTPANRERVVEVALNLADQPCLSPTDEQHVYRLPALKGSWALCAEGSEHPHTKVVRPVTFDENVSKGRDDVVLAHLNHRLVQMSLRLLRAEIWKPQGQKRLHRITAQVVPDNVLNTPAVIAHARLVVIGGDSHRLHEEIITAGGFIKEGRFNRMNVGQVADVLAAVTDDEPSAKVRKTLLGMWDKLASPLSQALTARMDDRTTGLEKKLAERAEKEASDIESILTELKRTIEVELDEPEYRQLELFDNIEREQFERNKDSLRARVREIPEEIERETAAVRARFAAPEPRMFPVAVTFLVPVKLAR